MAARAANGRFPPVAAGAAPNHWYGNMHANDPRNIRNARLAILVLSTVLLLGCNQGSTHIAGAIVVAGGKAVISAPGQPDAVVSVDGKLDIDGKRIAVTADQQQLLRDYYSNAMQVREHGIAAGKAGAVTGLHALTASITGLFDGKNKGQIASDVEASTQEVIDAAGKICHDLVRIQSTQDALAGQLPAFQPYARLTGNDVSECQDSMEKARHDVKQAQAKTAAGKG